MLDRLTALPARLEAGAVDWLARLTPWLAPLPRYCKTCRYWDFKASGTGEKCWGRCLHPQIYECIGIRLFPPSLPISMEMWAELKEYTELRFEENTFGCIYWEGWDDDGKNQATPNRQ